MDEMKRIERLKFLASISNHPSEVRMFREEINQIIRVAKNRR